MRYQHALKVTCCPKQNVSDLLACSGITDSATTPTSTDPIVHLTLFDSVPLEDASLYSQLIGSLIYLTVTRPDIAYFDPQTVHFTAVLRVLCYIKGTLGHGLQLSSKSSLVLSGDR